MDRSNIGLPAVLILVLALFGVSIRATPPAGGSSENKTAGERANLPAKVSKSSPHSALGLIEEFLDLDATSVVGASDPRKTCRVTFLIATLPDPMAPALRDMFDGRLDAIQRAAADAGFVLDRLDFPWPAPGAQGSAEKQGDRQSATVTIDAEKVSTTVRTPDGHTLPATTSLASLEIEGPEPRYERDPGVLLFRNKDFPKPVEDPKAPEGTELLVVFVVGEQPTSGVNKKALTNALDQIAGLLRLKKDGDFPPAYIQVPDGTVLLLGPSFSGSVYSIGATLRSWLDSIKPSSRPNVRIVSGSATAVGDRFKPWGLGFQTTVVPVSSRMFAEWVTREFGVSNSDLALLSEIGTAYGESYSGLGSTNPSAPTPSDTPQRPAGASTPAAAPAATSTPPFLSLEFPLHISDLRAAAAKRKRASSTPPGPQLSLRNVPLPEDEDSQENYIPPLYSPRSSSYDELILSNILSVLRRERIRYVGIAATDIADRLFLSQQIRANCPNTTIIQLEAADLLYLHSDINPDLLGSLVLSSYPLFTESQRWTYPFQGETRRVLFGNDLNEATYNATLALLGHPEKMIEYSSPFADLPTGPVVWLSIVGRNAIWPLRFRPPDKCCEDHLLPAAARSPDAPFAPTIQLDRGLYPPALIVAFSVLSVFCFVPCLLIWHYSQESDQVSPAHEPVRFALLLNLLPLWPARLLSGALRPRLRRAKRIYIAAFAMGLLTTYILGWGIFFLPLRFAEPGILTQLWFILLAVLSALLAVFMATALATASRRAWQQCGFKLFKTPAFLVLAATAIAFALASCFVVRIWTRSFVEALLFFLRSADLRDGVSPLMPLLFLGIAATCVIVAELWRVTLLDECRIRKPFLNFNREAFTGLEELEKALIKALDCTVCQLPGSMPAAAILLLIFLFALGGITPERWLDGLSFKYFFGFVALFVYVELSFSLLRFAFIWATLKSLLRFLYWHPTGSVYEKLRVASVPASLVEKQSIKILEPRPTFKALEFCLSRAKELLRLAEANQTQPLTPLLTNLARQKNLLACAVLLAEKCLSHSVKEQVKAFGDRVGSTSGPPWGEAILSRLRSQQVMAAISEIVTSVFGDEWSLKLSIGDKSTPTVDDELLANGELFIAARVTDLLRNVTPHLLNLGLLGTAGLVSIVLAVSVYPFPMHERIEWLSWLVLLSAAGVNLAVLSSMNRDRVISMLLGTTPGKLNFTANYMMQVLVLGVIPILSLLGVQFPGPIQSALSWFSRSNGSSPLP